MRYVVVTLRYTEDKEVCAICCTPLGKSYTRDLSTRIVYHNPWCLEAHERTSVLAIEDAGRMTP